MVILWIFLPWWQIEWTSGNQDLGVALLLIHLLNGNPLDFRTMEAN